MVYGHYFKLLFTLLYTVAFHSKYFSYKPHCLTEQNNFLTPLSILYLCENLKEDHILEKGGLHHILENES